MDHVLVPEDRRLPGIRVRVPIPDLSRSGENTGVVHQHLHTVRRHDPQISDFDCSAVLFPLETALNVHITVAEVVSVHFHRVPERCRRHKRVRTIPQHAVHVLPFAFDDAVLAPLVDLPGQLAQGLRQGFQAGEVCDFRPDTASLAALGQPLRQGFTAHAGDVSGPVIGPPAVHPGESGAQIPEKFTYFFHCFVATFVCLSYIFSHSSTISSVVCACSPHMATFQASITASTGSIRWVVMSLSILISP